MSDLREIIHSAYSYIRSTEVNKAASALTLDHLIQEQIKALKKGETATVTDDTGEAGGGNLSRWDRLDALERSIDQVVQALTDAGDDQDKLSALGVLEASSTTKGNDEASSNVGENAR